MTKVRAAIAALAAAAGALLLSSCLPPAEPITLDEIAARALPYTHTAKKDAVVQSVNALAIDLYARLASTSSQNIFFSPFSISAALAMTYAGARGTTETEMAAALHFTLPRPAPPSTRG
jgi:serpin B